MALGDGRVALVALRRGDAVLERRFQVDVSAIELSVDIDRLRGAVCTIANFGAARDEIDRKADVGPADDRGDSCRRALYRDVFAPDGLAANEEWYPVSPSAACGGGACRAATGPATSSMSARYNSDETFFDYPSCLKAEATPNGQQLHWNRIRPLPTVTGPSMRGRDWRPGPPSADCRCRKGPRTYLQGLLTNDIEALTAGTGCYSAWLTPQGRMLTDMHVLESGDMMLLDVPADQLQSTLQRLDQFLFSEDVQLADRPAACGRCGFMVLPLRIVERVVHGLSGVDDWPDYRTRAPGSRRRGRRCASRPARGPRSVHLRRAGGRARVARCAARRGSRAGGCRRSRGRPHRGWLSHLRRRHDRGHDPARGGYRAREISFTKGCYVGQEVIIRVLHRGDGRVAKRLDGAEG